MFGNLETDLVGMRRVPIMLVGLVVERAEVCRGTLIMPA